MNTTEKQQLALTVLQTKADELVKAGTPRTQAFELAQQQDPAVMLAAYGNGPSGALPPTPAPVQLAALRQHQQDALTVLRAHAEALVKAGTPRSDALELAQQQHPKLTLAAHSNSPIGMGSLVSPEQPVDITKPWTRPAAMPGGMPWGEREKLPAYVRWVEAVRAMVEKALAIGVTISRDEAIMRVAHEQPDITKAAWSFD